MNAHKSDSLAENLIFLAVRIVGSNYGGSDRSVGTGFFYNYLLSPDQAVPVIVSNKHVLTGFDILTFEMARITESGERILEPAIEIEMDGGLTLDHPDEHIDLAIFPLLPIWRKMEHLGHKPYKYVLTAENFIPHETLLRASAMEYVVMVGFPNGLRDSTNNLPILRNGMTATPLYSDYENKREFLVDLPVFGGSSGSPIFMYRQGIMETSGESRITQTPQIFLVGILYAGHYLTTSGEIVVDDSPASMRPMAVIRQMINVGICIKAECLSDFTPLIGAVALELERLSSMGDGLL